MGRSHPLILKGTDMKETNLKRRFFRRAAIATFAVALGAGFGAHAWSHGGGHGGMHRGFMGGSKDPAKADQRIERMVKRFAARVDATPEQQSRLTEIAKAAAKDL